jgi:hypothetical protein
MTTHPAPTTGRPERGWPRAAALFGVVVSLSVLQPSVMIAIPLLALIGTRGIRGGAMLVLATVAMTVTVLGVRDGVWYVERAWALLTAGWFVGLTLAQPTWRPASRALSAVVGASASAAALLAARPIAWEALDFTISSRVVAGVTNTLDAVRVLRQGDPLPAALVSGMYEMAETQASVFPAMLALASMAALGVAWWVYVRAGGGGDQGLGPVRDFRFNDHLVWAMIGGLLLMVLRWGDSLSRVGANVVVFMAALYALRGAGVVMFVSGGISLLGFAALGFGLLAAPPVVVGVAVLIGIGDTWLDLRARVGAATR